MMEAYLEQAGLRGRRLSYLLIAVAAAIAIFALTPDMANAASKTKKICSQYGGGLCTIPAPMTPIQCRIEDEGRKCAQSLKAGSGPSNNDVCVDAPSGSCTIPLPHGYCGLFIVWKCKTTTAGTTCAETTSLDPAGIRQYCM